MLLNNAYCCLYGCEAASYFNYPPPTLDDWLGQGLNAKPIPNDIIFSDEHEFEVAPEPEADEYAAVAEDDEENNE